MTTWQLFKAWAFFTDRTVKKADFEPEHIKNIEAAIQSCLDGCFDDAYDKMIDAGILYFDSTDLETKERAHKVYNHIRHFARNTGRIAVSGSYPNKTEKLAWELLANKVHIADLIDAVATILDEAAEPEIVLKSYDGIEISGVIKRLRALGVIAKDTY